MNAFDSIYSNNVQALREYLELGDVNIKNERGLSLLHSAIVFNNSEIFDLLLENYININNLDANGDTPVHYCVMHNRMGFLKMLIRHNADLTIRDAKGQSPLYKACMLGRENMISLLLESLSFDIQDEDNNNETIFMALIRSRNLDLLHKIIVDEELVNQANYLGETPLHIAAKSGDIRIVSYLLENKAFIHRKNNLGETPLYYAVKYWNSDVIDFLISKGALMGMKTKAGESAYDLLLKPEHLAYITEREEKYKLKQYISTYPLHYAILLEDYELIQKNCVIRNLYREDIYGYTPIRLANCIGNPKIIKILKEKL